MKVLSLWQPWATLIAIGAKRIETRHWSTSYRGPILIHAAKCWTRDLQDMAFMNDDLFYRTLNAASDAGKWKLDPLARGFGLPFGAVVAAADLVDCLKITGLEEAGVATLENGEPVAGTEFDFGNYEAGRYAWLLKNVRRFPDPIPMTGHQGLFNMPPDFLLNHAAAIAKAVPA